MEIRRLRLALGALGLVLVGGTIGYLILGFSLLQSVFQTVTTITTVGFAPVRPLSVVGEVFTIVLILLGVGTALYAFGLLLEVLVQGHMTRLVERRRMNKDIARLSGQVIVCGWGRVGRASYEYLTRAGRDVLVVDRDPERVVLAPCPGLSETALASGTVLIALGTNRQLRALATHAGT
ncbi:MAG TPA: potassium channel family protein [Mycobacteriales bacterium]|nr:potassium channel family protein [Mycobacteriales bacterium]